MAIMVVSDVISIGNRMKLRDKLLFVIAVLAGITDIILIVNVWHKW